MEEDRSRERGRYRGEPVPGVSVLLLDETIPDPGAALLLDGEPTDTELELDE